MLKKINRLKSRSAYSATYHNNNIISNEIALLYAGKIKQDKTRPTRVGFVVSKKVHKRAVQRNRIKRLMRESIRLIIKNNKADALTSYQSLIFIARENAIGKNYEEIHYSILTLLEKLAI